MPHMGPKHGYMSLEDAEEFLGETMQEHQADELDDRSPDDPTEFTETAAGQQARHDWARRYDDLNGAPEGDWDR